jgi:hypothetical protein
MRWACSDIWVTTRSTVRVDSACGQLSRSTGDETVMTVDEASPFGMMAHEASVPFQAVRIRALVALIPCGLAIFVAAQYLAFMLSPANGVPAFTDALWYQAAGERLNAGHLLYALSPGDRAVFMVPGITTAPLLSPPPIAVLWRLIVMIPLGFQLWVLACWAAVLSTTFYLVFRTGLAGAVVAAAVSPAIGEQLAACNVAAFFPGLLVLTWKWRGDPPAGRAIALMAALKLTPGAMAGWLVGSRQWRGLVAATLTIVGLVIVSVVGSSIGAFADYIQVARTAGPSTSSVSGLTGLPWASAAVLVVGTMAVAGLGRWPRIAFIAGVVVTVVGTPSLYLSGLVTLIATLAPFADAPGWSHRA